MATGKQRKTFLSYSRTNTDFVKRLAKELKAEGFSVFLDQLDIPAGTRWDVELEKALEECEIFMIIMTPASIASENVRDEIGYAIDNGKRFLPVLLEKCTVPLRLRRFQYVDFTNKSFDEGVESAKDLLRGLIAQPTIPQGQVPDLQSLVESGRKIKEEADQLAKQKADEEVAAKTRAETERKAKEEADYLAAQKIEKERAAKATLESERKTKEEADRLAAQKIEKERAAKAESERLAKKEAESPLPKKMEEKPVVRAEGKQPAKEKPTPVETKKDVVSVASATKKPLSMGIIGGIVVIVVIVIAIIGSKALAQRGTPTASATVEIAHTATKAQSTTTTIASSPTPKPTETQAPTETPAPPKLPSIKFVKNTNMEELFNTFSIGPGDVEVAKDIYTALSDDGLVPTLNAKYIYLYYMYKPYTYKDIAVKIEAQNLGSVTLNNISLVCRKTNNTWYEYGVTSTGLWGLYTHSDNDNKSKYTLISSGPTNAIKGGQNVNVYEMQCIGKDISLYINGKKVKTIQSDLYTEGQVGFNISSLEKFPVTVKVSKFDVFEP